MRCRLRAASVAAVLGVAAAAAWFVTAASAQTPSAAAVVLVDDVGAPLGSPVEACFQVTVRAQCGPVPAGQTVEPVAGAEWLTVEGERHGPVRVSAAHLRAGRPVIVPRKARLRVIGVPEDGITLSLYLPDDPTFRQPAHRLRLSPAAAEPWIPARAWIASLTVAGLAPDLHRVVVSPGASAALRTSQKPGWSLLARVVAPGTALPVAGSAVEVLDTPGFGRDSRVLARLPSGDDGLVLMSGVVAPVVTLRVAQPLVVEEPAVSASPGTFTFREVALQAGGRLAAVVASSRSGPIEGAECALLTRAATYLRDSREEVLWVGQTQRDGRCTSAALSAASYVLRVRPPEGNGTFTTWVTLVEGETVEQVVDLVPTLIRGVVTRGDEPVADYQVRASFVWDDAAPFGRRAELAAEAATDSEGRYELVLWRSGKHLLALRDAGGAAVAGVKPVVAAGDEHTVDFELPGASVAGRVVDAAGAGIEGAWVTFEGSETQHATTTDRQGGFSFDPGDSTAAMLRSGKVGYLDSAETPVAIHERSAPVILTLERSPHLRGVLVTATGGAVPGALLASVSDGAMGPTVYATARSGADGSFEVALPGLAARVYASGPGCPLGSHRATVSPETEAVTLSCAPVPAAVALSYVAEDGTPIAQRAVLLRSSEGVIPYAVLAAHVREHGLWAETDGQGRLFLPGLAPGRYDLFEVGLASEETIQQGREQGFLGTVDLAALATAEMHLVARPTGGAASDR